MSKFTDHLNGGAWPNANSATPVAPTRQAVLPPSAAVRQTGTSPARTGNAPGADMAAFQRAAQENVRRIMTPPGQDRPGRDTGTRRENG